MIKAIDTRYNNHLFRSRLEARWALYFDEIKVKWLYETEGYKIGNEYYLPDFYFPELKIFAEVKPIRFDWQEIKKIKLLAIHSQKRVVQLVGLPNIDKTEVIIPYQYYSCSECGKMETYDFDLKTVYCNCKVKHNVVDAIQTKECLFIPNKTYPPFIYEDLDSYEGTNEITNAIKKAKEARFEFNTKNK